jgi:hypothetical protein
VIVKRELGWIEKEHKEGDNMKSEKRFVSGVLKKHCC